jgi:hypothetical protein
LYAFLISPTRATFPAHVILLDFITLIIRWSVQVMKLLVMQSSLTSRHFLQLKSKYSLQNPVLKHPNPNPPLSVGDDRIWTSSECGWTGSKTLVQQWDMDMGWRRQVDRGDRIGNFKSCGYRQLKVKSLCLTKHHSMKTYWGIGGLARRILDLGTRWRPVVSFTPWPLYSQRRNTWYPLDRRLGGPQSRSGRGGEEKNFQSPPGIES